MTNFNPINNFMSLSSNISKSTPAGMVEGSQNNPAPQNNSGEIINYSILQNSQTSLVPSLSYNLESTKMDSEALLKYLQNLMSLPNSIDKFIEQITKNPSNQNALKILVQNMINISALGEFLNENSSSAITKLIQIIASSQKTSPSSLKELSEVLSILSAIQASTSSSNTNSLRELLLLYIPLNYQIFDKKEDIKPDSEEEKEAIKNSTLSILFKTINFSNMLCSVNEENNMAIVCLYANNFFPEDKFLYIINSFSKESNFNMEIEIKHSSKNNSSAQEQNFRVISDGFISLNVLILSHLIIKTVFKIDNDFT